MWSPSQFYALLSAEQRGVLPMFARGLLRGAALPYEAVVRLRNRCFDSGWGKVHAVDAGVISIGNLTVGGTGKTPLVAWLVAWCQRQGLRPAIVSRGYRSLGMENDEAIELAQKLPGIPHLQDRDRVAVAREAVATTDANVIILDDGMQHRRLARDLEVVVLDALQPFGFDYLLPRGTLREPVSSLRRADVVICNRADLVEPEVRAQIRERVARLAPRAVWAEAMQRPAYYRSLAGQRAEIADLGPGSVAAFCGIGNPEGFRRLVMSLGHQLVAWHDFPDHYHYSSTDLADVCAAAQAAGAPLALCTHKDLVKLTKLGSSPMPIWAVIIETTFLCGEAEFENVLRSRIA